MEINNCNNLECCCKCINLKKVMCHPQNKTIGKGNVTTQLGYVCILGNLTKDTYIFFESKHGRCKLFNK